MSVIGKIAAAKRFMEQYGIVPSRITMGRDFHEALLAEMEACRGWHGTGEAPPAPTRALTVHGLEITVCAESPPGDAWIGARIG